MHANKLYENDPAADLSNSKVYVESLIVLQGAALAYYFVLIGTDVIWTRKVNTAATDGVYVYINPDFFKNKCASPSQRAFILAHEVGHIVLKHMMRGRFYKHRGFFAMKQGAQIPWSHSGYNHAGDYVINADLIAHGLEAPAGVLLRDTISRDHLVDNVYMDLWAEHQEKKAEQEEAQQELDEQDQDDTPDESEGEDDDSEESDEPSDEESDEGEPESGDDGESSEDDAEEASGASDDEGDDEGAGSGSGGDPFEDTLDGESHDEHLEPDYDGEPDEQEEQAKADEEEIERRVDDALDGVKDATERGEVPVASSSAFEKGGNRHSGGNASSISWRGELADRVTRIGQQGEASWKRIHRRRFTMLGTITPSFIGTFDRLALIVDISGSVDRVQLQQFLIELAKLIDDLQPSSGCLVMFTNTEVVETHEVYCGGDLLDLEVPYGGGTTMSAGIQYMEENGLEADITLCFTDGELWGDDMQNLADHNVVMVLDSVPYSYTQRDIDQSGIDYIVACDDLAA